MGGTAIDFQLDGVADMAGSLDSGVENTLFTLLDAMQASTFTALVVVVLIMLVLRGGSGLGSPGPRHVQPGRDTPSEDLAGRRVGLMIGAVAIALLLAGGLSAIQTTVIVFGIPFLLVMMWVCDSLVRQLRQEPVTTTVPPGVRTVIAESRAAQSVSSNGAAPPSAGTGPRSEQLTP